MTAQHAGALTIGVLIGFLGGLFGKGGSAVATPLLSLIGYSGFVAVAAPLPATIPGMLLASVAYWGEHLIDWQLVLWSIALGAPATIAGAGLSDKVGERALLILTGVLVLGFGISFLLDAATSRAKLDRSAARPSWWRLRVAAVAIGVGLVSGLLANSGGFLLAPSYYRFLRMRLKEAFACSLAVAIALAVPGTYGHWRLGHISWPVVGFIALGSVPCSYLGARVALRTSSARLKGWYGAALTALGTYFLFRLRAL
jgi:uncharacterized membrane protein YfcA